jgi:hypothetical protein
MIKGMDVVVALFFRNKERTDKHHQNEKNDIRIIKTYINHRQPKILTKRFHRENAYKQTRNKCQKIESQD